MQRMPFWRTNAIIIGLASWVTTSAVSAADPSCLACHDKEAKAFTVSAHAQAGLSCVDCHGGNPNDKEATAHGTDNFKRPDNKKAIAELCAKCHSDVRKMNPYGLPTDQLERYKTSKHGEQLFEHNDQKVATCTDCHGVHDILKVHASGARTQAVNIPQTCGRCHGDAKLMDQYKLKSDVVTEYKKSYHAHMVLDKGDTSAPTCITCHGYHGATPPGTKEVGQVCGKCHVRQRELFTKSPHAEAVEAGAFNECVSCHGNHAIQKASIELYATSCVQCHANDKKQLAVRDSIADLIRGAMQDTEQADDLVHKATLRGLPTEDDQVMLQEAKTQLTQLQALQHTLDIETLKPVAKQATDIANQTKTDIAGLEHNERAKRLALVPAWIFLMVMAVLFWLKRREIEKEGR